MPSVVCPFCFASAPARTFPYRCQMSTTGVRGTAPCPASPDETWARFTGLAPTARAALRGPCFDPPRRAGHGTRVPCPDCGVATSVRVCRNCHTDLPGEYCAQGSRIIALIGPKTAGKSTYVTVLAHEMQQRAGTDRSSFTPVGAHTQDRFTAMESALYDQLLLPGPTQPAALRLNDPLLFRLSTPRRGIPGRRGGSRHTMLVFFDAAGEDLANAEAMNRYTAYLAAADGVLLLVDPLQLRPVRDRLADTGALLPARETAPEQIAADLAVQLRSHRRGEDRGQVTTPVAVALTKSDMLRVLLDPDSPLLRPAPDRGPGGSEEDRQAVHQEVRAVLEDWGGGVLLRQLERDFANFALFALTALGDSPDPGSPGDAPSSGLRPRRVEDPLLWLLDRRGGPPLRALGKGR
ncbi:TRAFAC clade GTPase domain-containing protein [Streptomyces sp. NPDC004031]